MDSTEDRLVRYYRGFNEWRRLGLDPYHRLEFETTLYFLRKYLPQGGLLLDAGGGPGRYAIELARVGYEVVLLDLMPEHLRVARRQIRRAGVQGKVRELHQGSIEDLSRFGDESFDGVLCLGGALGHLVNQTQRRRALRELARVAKPRAPVFLSVIGRFSVMVGELTEYSEELENAPEIVRQICRTGDYDGSRGFAPSHFFLLEQLQREVRASHLRVLESVGLEGLASRHPREANRLARDHPRRWKVWEELHRLTCTQPPIVAMSEHFMVIARKPRARKDSDDQELGTRSVGARRRGG
jgi:ubiquinone/menaquinone biosynthesis C-methylase UbiE